MVAPVPLHTNKVRRSTGLDLIIIGIYTVAVFYAAGHYDLLENFFELSRKYENLELDEVITVGFFLSFALVYFSLRRWWEATNAASALRTKVNELEKALSEIRQLQGIIPICASCKKMRDDDGYWHQVEAYLTRRSAVAFTHGMCEQSAGKLYPEFVDRQE